MSALVNVRLILVGAARQSRYGEGVVEGMKKRKWRDRKMGGNVFNCL
jgi:hypothetical protein